MMSPPAQKVFDDALALPVDARLHLVEQLLASLNLPVSGEIEQIWQQESERRVAELEQGKAQLVDGPAVFNRIRGKYQR